MDLGLHVSLRQRRARRAPSATPQRKPGSRTLARGSTAAVWSFFEGGAFWHQWRGLQQVRYERADSQGFEATDGGALAGPFGVRGWRQSRDEFVWRHETVRRSSTNIQELGSRDVNLVAAIEFTENGLHMRVNKSDDQETVLQWYSNIEHAIPTEMRFKDHEVCSDKCLQAHADASSWDIQESVHVAGRIVREPVHVPARKLHTAQQVVRRARRQRGGDSTRQHGRHKCV